MDEEKEKLVRRSADDLPRSTAEDRERLRKAMEGPIDTSDSPEKKGAFNRIRRKIDRTPEQLVELLAARDAFQAEKPSLDQLVASGDYAEPSLVPCDHPGCDRESTHSRSVWITPGHMKVEYYCLKHAPADATTFEEDEAEEDRIDAEAAREAMADYEVHGGIPWEDVKVSPDSARDTSSPPPDSSSPL